LQIKTYRYFKYIAGNVAICLKKLRGRYAQIVGTSQRRRSRQQSFY